MNKSTERDHYLCLTCGHEEPPGYYSTCSKCGGILEKNPSAEPYPYEDFRFDIGDRVKDTQTLYEGTIRERGKEYHGPNTLYVMEFPNGTTLITFEDRLYPLTETEESDNGTDTTTA